MEDIQKAVKACFAKYADFTGRADRPEFWWFALFQFVLFLVLSLVSSVLYGIAALALLLPGLAVGARRLHDVGRSGWWLLLGFVPLIGVLVLIYWAVQPGEPGANRFGAPAGSAPAIDLAPGQQ